MLATMVDAREARQALADEWARQAPTDAAGILDFYRTADQSDDLAAFHRTEMRRKWTALVCDVVTTTGARSVVDIGCGAGHDLRALRAAVDHEVYLGGVDPSDIFRERLLGDGFDVKDRVEAAPVETADVLVCLDVLEHVTDPEAFLGSIARRAKVGAALIETAATHDIGTPLHLRANRGWRTGRALETAGWERTFEQGRVRVWQRMAEAPRVEHAGLALCAYRGVSTPTFRSVVNLVRHDPEGRWRVMVAGEAGIARARSQVTSWWHSETADQVLLMIDDDLAFKSTDAERIVQLCRDGMDIVCGAYPTRDASHLALRGHGEDILFGPGKEPIEIQCAATGFIAFHRRVIDAMVKVTPLCNANLEDAFYPIFDMGAVPNEATGGHDYLSEDFFFSELAKSLGFRIWLDPSIILGHLAEIELNVGNMMDIRAVLERGR